MPLSTSLNGLVGTPFGTGFVAKSKRKNANDCVVRNEQIFLDFPTLVKNSD